MTKLYEDIRGECSERGLGECGGRCLYAKGYYACNEASCPQVANFCGKRPADMLVDRFNLKAQFEAEIVANAPATPSAEYRDVEGM